MLSAMLVQAAETIIGKEMNRSFFVEFRSSRTHSSYISTRVWAHYCIYKPSVTFT